MSRQRHKPTAAEVENDPVILGIERLLARSPEAWWCGSATDLLEELSRDVPEGIRRQAIFWPQTPKGLGTRVGTLSIALDARDIIVTRRNIGTRGFCISRRIKAAARTAA